MLCRLFRTELDKTDTENEMNISCLHTRRRQLWEGAYNINTASWVHLAY